MVETPRKGQNAGPENPNYGKSGDSHPSFGHVVPEQARKRLSEQRRGVGNPNYGCQASDETRAKMSATRKGRPMPSSRRGLSPVAHQMQDRQSPVYIVLAWLWVAIPFGYGVYELMIKVKQLFE